MLELQEQPERDLDQLPLGVRRPPDELANLLTHGLGCLLAIAGAVVLNWLARDCALPFRQACAVYGFSLVGLYAASTLSHAFFEISWRRFFRSVDQAFIYVLIAGSYTPFVIGYGEPAHWWRLLGMMWTLAGLGVVLVMWQRDLTPAAKITFLLLGWLPALGVDALWTTAPAEEVFWIIAGGLFYSLGTILLFNDHLVRYLHALWHAFVMAGSVSHFIAIVLLSMRL